MNPAIIKAIMHKDIKIVGKSKKMWMPMLIITILICGIFPAALAYVGFHTKLIPADTEIQSYTDKMIGLLPDGDAKAALLELGSIGKQLAYYFLNFSFVALFMMITVINSSVTSESSFASEKERGTLETLLFSPISARELFIGKVLATLVPVLVLSYASYFLSVITVNAVVYPVYPKLMMLNMTWIALLFWVTPALILLTILLNVLVSARSRTLQEAQQLGRIIVLPVIGLIVSQVAGLFLLTVWVCFAIGLVLFGLSAVLLFFISKYNNRNVLFESQIR